MMKAQGIAAPRGIRNGGGDWLVPVQVGYESANDTQALAYLVADNKLTIDGHWDEVALASLLQEVANSTDVAVEATGYDADELDDLLRDLNPLPPDDFPEFGDDIETEYCCPKCKYEWSGKPK
jgi:hypothetical protein